MSSQPKLFMMAWTGLGWRSWGAEPGRSNAKRVKPRKAERFLIKFLRGHNRWRRWSMSFVFFLHTKNIRLLSF